MLALIKLALRLFKEVKKSKLPEEVTSDKRTLINYQNQMYVIPQEKIDLVMPLLEDAAVDSVIGVNLKRSVVKGILGIIKLVINAEPSPSERSDSFLQYNGKIYSLPENDVNKLVQAAMDEGVDSVLMVIK